MATLSGLTWSESQLLTRSAPTTDATEGLPLVDCDAVTVVIEAESGQTLSGGGNLRCYVYDETVGAWFRMPALDLAVSTSGSRRIAFETLEVAGPRRTARALWACDTVTASGGTTATVYALGYGAEYRGR